MSIDEYCHYLKNTVITDEISMLDSLVSHQFVESYSQDESYNILKSSEGAFRVSRISFRMMVSFSETFSPDWVEGIRTQTQYMWHRIIDEYPIAFKNLTIKS